MSRLGKKIIAIPEKTQVLISDGNVSVKGPLGELSRNFNQDIIVSLRPEGVELKPAKETKESMALWGTYVSHISNMIKGVNKQFVKKLVVEGIGFKVDLKGEKLVFALGFSHPVEVSVHQGISASVEKNVITISGVSKELVGEFTARLRDLKKPEPYKGKGVRYEEEVVKIKQGKKSV
ncbi:MAG: 50S ribosomal protein L6 [Candidatus Zambryskibacteria bacterium RIFCSPHIGHO2_01_FULL_43_25]|uniref:50S ribosomal protein L6 n=1 Tax=Candidatus Zambryskibacteria bacterium RIFCSPLOWO2_01_FULL_45_21 TaxID=1802761 RepID=A0A1G2U4L5_9BACT|nr:MAG: 50S ribosomal protein L6 [Candidatus Zambryskibacteria bacterium RIFCSPHIGHO2_01_FULL_43_25]OHB00845.1 MAG: 50S ribosomal protein L6 [Candidatus Zambryskibacteria bacterium RIFCSPHIGHO2_12_FULL_44_12b]OHB04429.1 MAG: 50S ribosomal protein L6 [Candidatus Zambryskibacteria bacterium RIFCSPLOWO2_01_FULL_45_21]